MNHSDHSFIMSKNCFVKIKIIFILYQNRKKNHFSSKNKNHCQSEFCGDFRQKFMAFRKFWCVTSYKLEIINHSDHSIIMRKQFFVKMKILLVNLAQNRKKNHFHIWKLKFISLLLYPFQFIFQRRCLLAQSKNFSFQNWFLYRLNFKKIFGQIGIGNGRFIRNLFNSLSIDIIQLFDHKIVKNLFMDSSSYP